MRGEYAWFVLGSKNLPSRFKKRFECGSGFFFFFYSVRERRTHQRGGVQLNTISKPIKGCIRITAMYLLLWDITLRVLQLQSGGSKFHWLERWGAIETEKKKAKKNKNPSVQKWSQPIIHTELNILAVLYADDLSNTRKKSGSLSERLFRIHGVFLTVASAGGCCQTPVHPKMHLCGASNVWRFFCSCCWENVSEDVLWDCCNFGGFLWAS